MIKNALLSIGILWFGSLISAGFSFFTQIFLARELGPTNFGLFAAILAIANLTVPLATFGVSQYWLREYGLRGWAAKKYITPSLKLVVTTTSFSIFIMISWGFLGPHDISLRYALIFMAFYVVGQVGIDLVTGKFQLEEKYTALAIWQLMPHFVRFLLVVLLSFFTLGGLNLISAVAIFSLVAGVWLIFSFYHISRLVSGKLSLKGHESTAQVDNEFEIVSAIHVVKNAWPFGLAGIFHLIYFYSDIILVKYIIGDEAAGLYNVAFMILVMIILFPSIVYQKFLLPKIHRWAIQDRVLFYKVYKQGNLIMLVLGLFAMLLAGLLAPYGIPFLFGENYQKSIDLFMILIFSIPLLFVASSVGASLVTRDNMKTKVKLMGLVAAVNVILNMILIPFYGAFGAAIATVFSNFMLLVLFLAAAKTLVFNKVVNCNQ